ncbi:Calcineurin-like phosphoesterase [Novymonas esmeraldas]|uniref:Calcineurin-like phosphoesterase n=1 Tax=Novymonas esmeraldas TaxID=1808958 RepID=A0AAW0EPF0_9TRYP
MSFSRRVELFLARAYSRKGVQSGLFFWTVLAIVLAATFVVSNVPLGLYTPTVGFQQGKHRAPPLPPTTPAPAVPAGRGILRAPHQRIIAIGDLHGDMARLRSILRAAEVLEDDTDAWRDGCTDIVVQLGDIVDRGPDAPQMLRLLSELRPQALAAGGRLITLSGNHELLALTGVSVHAHAAVMNASGGTAGFRHLYSPGGRYGRMLAEENLVVAIVSDVVFVHGGLTAAYARRGVDELNAAWFQNATAANLSQNVFADSASPLWDRSITQEAMIGNCGPLSAGMAALKAKERIDVNMMVVGHTPMSHGRVGTWCGGKLMTIDVAMSRYMQDGGYEAFLSFDPTVAKVGKRKKTRTLDAQDRVHIHYPLGSGVRAAAVPADAT